MTKEDRDRQRSLARGRLQFSATPLMAWVAYPGSTKFELWLSKSQFVPRESSSGIPIEYPGARVYAKRRNAEDRRYEKYHGGTVDRQWAVAKDKFSFFTSAPELTFVRDDAGEETPFLSGSRKIPNRLVAPLTIKWPSMRDV